jgi:hypothetical protein
MRGRPLQDMAIPSNNHIASDSHFPMRPPWRPVPLLRHPYFTKPPKAPAVRSLIGRLRRQSVTVSGSQTWDRRKRLPMRIHELVWMITRLVGLALLRRPVHLVMRIGEAHRRFARRTNVSQIKTIILLKLLIIRHHWPLLPCLLLYLHHSIVRHQLHTLHKPSTRHLCHP